MNAVSTFEIIGWILATAIFWLFLPRATLTFATFILLGYRCPGWQNHLPGYVILVAQLVGVVGGIIIDIVKPNIGIGMILTLFGERSHRSRTPERPSRPD